MRALSKSAASKAHRRGCIRRGMRDKKFSIHAWTDGKTPAHTSWAKGDESLGQQVIYASFLFISFFRVSGRYGNRFMDLFMMIREGDMSNKRDGKQENRRGRNQEQQNDKLHPSTSLRYIPGTDRARTAIPSVSMNANFCSPYHLLRPMPRRIFGTAL